MYIDLGKRIKAFRLKEGMTQEQLAGALHLSAQSVSKWENGVTLPDIQLLPKLSVLFGVSIDELFSLTDQSRFERIDHMLQREDDPPAANYEAAEDFLNEKIRTEQETDRAWTTLAFLHNHRAAGFRRKAAHAAKRAIALTPSKRENHGLLCEAFGGVVWDWCLTNHHEQIAYYQDFVAKNPDYHRGYLWLLENLLADYRLEEARQTAEAMQRAEESCFYLLYLGRIAAAEGDMALAQQHWEEMTAQYAGDCCAWSLRADACARLGLYEQAVELYGKAIALQSRPRLIDDRLSLAHIAEITGDWNKAAACYTDILDILKTDWDCSEGDAVGRYEQKIAACRARMK